MCLKSIESLDFQRVGLVGWEGMGSGKREEEDLLGDAITPRCTTALPEDLALDGGGEGGEGVVGPRLEQATAAPTSGAGRPQKKNPLDEKSAKTSLSYRFLPDRGDLGENVPHAPPKLVDGCLVARDAARGRPRVF